MPPIEEDSSQTTEGNNLIIAAEFTLPYKFIIAVGIKKSQREDNGDNEVLGAYTLAENDEA